MASDFDPYHRWLGIPPEEQPPDHYRLLGVSRFESDREVISNASDQRMIHLRSFAAGKRSAESQRLLNEVAAATHCLLDPSKKAAYDAELRSKVAAKGSQPAKPLPVAVAISPGPGPSPRRPLPLQPVPLSSGGVQQTAVATAVAEPSPSAAAGYTPPIVHRRAMRRGSNSGITFAVLSLALTAMVGAGAIYAYRASQQVVEKPSDPPREKQTKPKPTEPIVTPTPVKPEASKPKPAEASERAIAGERNAWHYSRSPEGAQGVVYHVAGKRWEEKSSDGRKHQFVELQRTDEAISLKDASRKLTIWLKSDQMTYSRNGSKETYCMRGEWIAAEELAPLLASLDSPSKPTEARPVAVHHFNGEGVARLNMPRGTFDSGKPLTVEFWYRREGELNTSAGLLQLGDLNLVLRYDSQGERERTYFQIFSASTGTAWNAKGELTPDQEWHHLAIAGDAGKINIYHDGKPVNGVSLTEPGTDALEPIAFGSAQSDRGVELFQGEIKSIRVSDKARYRDGQIFAPPPVQSDELLPETSLALSELKSTPREPTSSNPPTVDVSPPLVETPAKGNRTPPPEGDSLKAAQAAVSGVFGERLRLAIKPEDKQKLAAELLKTAANDSDAALAYALLLEGRRLAVAAMDVALGVEIISELDRRFEVERVVLLEKLISELERRSLAPQQREILVDEAFAGTVAAINQDNVIVADSLAVFATRSASKGKDLEKKKAALALREQAAAVKSAWEAMRAGRQKLEKSPDDPAANLAVGRYLVFARGDFAKGCEHLVKGNDAAMAAAAQKQLAVQNDDDQLAAIETWSSLLSSLKSPAEKLQLQRHIVKVCEELKPRLTGLALAQAEKHVNQLRPIIAEADKYIRGQAVAASKAAPGLIARVFASRNGTKIQTPFVAVAKNASDLARLNTIELLRAYGGRARYVLAGVVVVESDMEVLLQFEDCNVALLNENRVATNLRPISQRIMLKKGIYPIAIESTGFTFAFDVANADSMESLLFHHPGNLDAELSRPGFDPAGVQVKSQQVN